NMGMEMEFDHRALAASPANMRDRLSSYIKGFEKNNVCKDASVAYYEGGNGFHLFAKSTNPLDKELIDELAAHIIARKEKKFYRKLTSSRSLQNPFTRESGNKGSPPFSWLFLFLGGNCSFFTFLNYSTADLSHPGRFPDFHFLIR